jgi:hypothetical protein
MRTLYFYIDGLITVNYDVGNGIAFTNSTLINSRCNANALFYPINGGVYGSNVTIVQYGGIMNIPEVQLFGY